MLNTSLTLADVDYFPFRGEDSAECSWGFDLKIIPSSARPGGFFGRKRSQQARKWEANPTTWSRESRQSEPLCDSLTEGSRTARAVPAGSKKRV